MTQRHRHPRRTVSGVSDELWNAFKALHGEGGASRRIRELIAADIQHRSDHTFRLRDSRTRTAPDTDQIGSRRAQDNKHALRG